MSIASTLGKAGSTALSGVKKAASTPAGKIAVTGAAVGGGSYAALSGAAAGIENITEKTGLKGIGEAITGSSESGKGIGTLMGTGLLILLAVLVVFVILPKARSNKR